MSGHWDDPKFPKSGWIRSNIYDLYEEDDDAFNIGLAYVLRGNTTTLRGDFEIGQPAPKNPQGNTIQPAYKEESTRPGPRCCPFSP